MNLNRVFQCIVLLLFLAGPAVAAPVAADNAIRINGSGSGLQMLKPLVEAYLKAHPEARIHMEKPLGSSGAIKALLGGAMDIAVSSRDLKPAEMTAGAVLHRYGQTPLALVTHQGVDRKDITIRELVDMYAGKTLTWPDGKPLRLILRPVEDADTRILRKLSAEMDAALTVAQNRPGMITAVTDPESIEANVKTPGSLGASGLTGVIVDRPALNVLSLNGIPPTPENLAGGSYPLAKPIDFVTLKNPPETAKKFLAFVYSSQGRRIALSAGLHVTAGDRSPW